MTRSAWTKGLLGVVAAVAFLAASPDTAQAGGYRHSRGHYAPRHHYSSYSHSYSHARPYYSSYAPAYYAPRYYAPPVVSYPVYAPAYYPVQSYYSGGCYQPRGFGFGFSYYH